MNAMATMTKRAGFDRCFIGFRELVGIRCD